MSAPSPGLTGRRFAGWLAAITVVAALLRGYGLADAPILGDDAAAGESAVQYVERAQIGPTMWQHPRLRDLAVYGSVGLLGTGKLGLAFASLLLGVLAVPLLALLGRATVGARAGLVAAALAAADPLHLDYSRQAVQEVYTFFFATCGVLLAVRHATRGRPGAAIASGVAFGLGLASKWSLAPVLAVTFAWVAARDARDPALPRAGRAASLSFDVAAYGLLPGAVYLATWGPWLLGGRDLWDWAALQARMAREAVSHAGFNPATIELPHRAAEWFVRPVAYADLAFGPDGPVPFVAVTNPIVWLLVLPAVGWLALRARRRGSRTDGLVVAIFVAAYLPLAAASRPIWVHSALALLPFALLAVGALVDDLAGRLARPPLALGAYLAAVGLLAAPLYLLATGRSEGHPLLRRIAEVYRPSAEHEGPPEQPRR